MCPCRNFASNRGARQVDNANGPPQVVTVALDGETYLSEMPFVTGLRTPTAELIGILLAKFPTPFPNRFIRHHDTTGKQQLFDIPVAEAEPEIEPYDVADDLDWEAVVLIGVAG